MSSCRWTMFIMCPAALELDMDKGKGWGEGGGNRGGGQWRGAAEGATVIVARPFAAS